MEDNIGDYPHQIDEFVGAECHECKHAVIDSWGYITCAAFPDGVPDDIMFEGRLHRRPIKGDHGIQFERGEPTREKD